jgi:hypothetical protein
VVVRAVGIVVGWCRSHNRLLSWGNECIPENVSRGCSWGKLETIAFYLQVQEEGDKK